MLNKTPDPKVLMGKVPQIFKHLQPQTPALNWVIAAGVVGADIGTSVFYGTGILFPIVGYLAPVFVLIACLMMWFFKKTYEEGLAMSPYNGGAYSMILRSLGRRFAVLAGALTFVSYLATAAVSSLSGSYYFSSLFQGGLAGKVQLLVAFFPLVFFGLLNSRGIKEPAKLVTLVAGLHFSLLMIIVVWGTVYIGLNFQEINFSKLSTFTSTHGELSFAMLAYGFAAAFLGITGFESAAQIVEELEAPALLTIRKLYRTVILLVSFTAPAISFLCLVILTPSEVETNIETLLSSMAFKMGGSWLRNIVVVDACLTLFAAVNTAFVGFIGLATTMAKQGNLPEMLLTRFAHRYPSLQGYPLIAMPFAGVSVVMAGIVSGEIDVVAKVYEISFLGVMVSFCVGTLLARNSGHLRSNIPREYLSKMVLRVKNLNISLVPLFSGLVLLFAVGNLFLHSSEDVGLMFTVLFGMIVLLMVYHRWGVLERRLQTHSDLRLGMGRFSVAAQLPEDLEPCVLCIGGTGERRLIAAALDKIFRVRTQPFELVVFHAEDGENEVFLFERLQRVVSQQIAPVFQSKNFVLTVKILPGSVLEGLYTLKKRYDFKKVFFGVGGHPIEAAHMARDIKKELEVNVEVIDPDAPLKKRGHV